MLKKTGCCLLLIALLSAMNVQWAVVQGVAWASMFSKETQQSATVREAIERTFGGDYPCEICGIVDANLKANPFQEAAGEVNYPAIKLLPLQMETMRLLAPAWQCEWQIAVVQPQRRLVFSPEPPPPRLV